MVSPSRLRPLGHPVAFGLLVGSALLVPAPEWLHAQSRRAPSPPDARAESASGREAARRAQRAFERLRRADLPVVVAGGGRACEATVGRYCYWQDTTARRPAARERARVTSARRRFIVTLDSLDAQLPRDRWIVGQRVRYRVDAGDTAAAVQVADRCTVGGWWCPALRGFARHVAGDFAGAELAFDEALAAMPGDQRCAWENPAVLLEPHARHAIDGLPCEARRRIAARTWWLATPLLSREGNDLRTEFLARRMASALEADARHYYDARWGWDAEEVLLRYGWPTWWTRERSGTLHGPREPHVVGHEAMPAFDFLPAPRLLTDTLVVPEPSDWDPARRLPTARHAAAHIATWVGLDAQVVRLLRGDTLLVVAVFDAPRDTTLRRGVATLVASASPGGPRFSSRPLDAGAGAAQLRMPRAALRGIGLVSLEVVDTTTRAVARHRAGLRDSFGGRLVLSDLLFHRPPDAAVATPALRDVIHRALPGQTVHDRRLGIYWETYGVVAGGEMLDVTITLERTHTPWLTRAAVRMGLGSRATPLQIRWRESPGDPDGVAARAVTIDVGSLAPGEYRVMVTAQADDGATAQSARVLTVPR